MTISVTTSRVLRMANDVRQVYLWAMQNGMKKPAQVEQIAKGLAMDLQELGVTVVDDSTEGG